MPELPEVEVTRRRIEPMLVGRRISAVRTTPNSYFFLTQPASLRRSLVGRGIVEIVRRGKYLLASLDDGKRLLMHLGMTGQLFYGAQTNRRLRAGGRGASAASREPAPFTADEHTHVTLCFEDGGPDVFFRDVRKFGKVRILARGRSDPRLDRLGVDALEASGDQLFRATRKRALAIKNLLLDQSVIAGIGNIYADEGLFLAGIRPGRRSRTLSRRSCEQLVSSVVQVLQRAIEAGGSSMSDFVAPDGQDGRYQSEHAVYAREGQPCLRCGSEVRRIMLGQRSAHYCPRCQV